MSPSVSCVIPTHARSDYLRISLQSAVIQTLRPDEVIVVSDIADIEAAEICAAVALGCDVPIRYVESPAGRSGASSSRNIGAAAASSDFLAFLDDDDEWLDTYLHDALQACAADPAADVVVTWIELFSGDRTANGPAILPGLAAHEVIAVNPGATGSNIVLRSSTFRALGGFDEQLPVKNDTDFFYRLLANGHRYVVNRSRSVRQRKHNQGQLTAKSEMRAVGVERYIAKHRASLTRRQVNALKFSIHRMRRHSAASGRGRAFHSVLALRYYSWAQFRDDRRNRNLQEFWSVSGFEETASHNNSS